MALTERKRFKTDCEECPFRPPTIHRTRAGAEEQKMIHDGLFHDEPTAEIVDTKPGGRDD